jgi:hypothetical protein
MTDRTIEEIASDAADTAGPDDATSPAHVADSVAASSPADAVESDAAGGGVVTKAAIADVEEAMKDVVDPELGINVVDLGLVYGTHVDDENIVTLDMTLTSAACTGGCSDRRSCSRTRCARRAPTSRPRADGHPPARL